MTERLEKNKHDKRKRNHKQSASQHSRISHGGQTPDHIGVYVHFGIRHDMILINSVVQQPFQKQSVRGIDHIKCKQRICGDSHDHFLPHAEGNKGSVKPHGGQQTNGDLGKAERVKYVGMIIHFNHYI